MSGYTLTPVADTDDSLTKDGKYQQLCESKLNTTFEKFNLVSMLYPAKEDFQGMTHFVCDIGKGDIHCIFTLSPMLLQGAPTGGIWTVKLADPKTYL